MAARWTPKDKRSALASLDSGGTIPGVSSDTGVPVGTLRRWKRDARRESEPAQVLDMKGAPIEVDPLADELAALCSGDPEVAIPAQMRVIMVEKSAATAIGQYGAGAAMQKQLAALRAELHAYRLTRPKDDPLDMSESEYVRRLEEMAGRWPLAHLEAVVSVYCDRVDARVVAAVTGGR